MSLFPYGVSAISRSRGAWRGRPAASAAWCCGRNEGGHKVAQWNGRKGATMAEQQPGLTPMDLGRYYMRRMAMRVDANHFQELCRTVAYASDPAHTAYSFAVHYGIIDLPTPEEIWRAGTLPA